MHLNCLLKMIDHNLDFEVQNYQQDNEELENNGTNEKIITNAEYNILDEDL